MILLAPVDSGNIKFDKGIFMSTEMGKAISEKIKSGEFKFSEPLYPVHLPFEGPLNLNFGKHDHLKMNKDLWNSLNLPSQYNGENLSKKKIIIFPMHGLGDQLYLATAIRNLASFYPEMEVSIAKSSIASAEQWYPFIYYDYFYHLCGPSVRMDELARFDYYLDAEHFAHIKEFNGTYPPEFYIKYFFHHNPEKITLQRPEIGKLDLNHVTRKSLIDQIVNQLKKNGKPLVYVGTMTTGRVRDIPDKTLLDFINQASEEYSLIVSTYKKNDLDKIIDKMHDSCVTGTGKYVGTVSDLIYLMQNVDYVLTPDSGITHLAEVLSIPCGSIFNVVTPDERTGPYLFSEELMIEFEIQGVCKTPCYIHALDEGDECPGMHYINEEEGRRLFWDYPPCMENLCGSHLKMLLDAVKNKFHK